VDATSERTPGSVCPEEIAYDPRNKTPKTTFTDPTIDPTHYAEAARLLLLTRPATINPTPNKALAYANQSPRAL